MPTVYQDRVQADGSASNQYVYGSKIPQGKVLKVFQITAHTFTTNLGDYETAKYINLGVQVNDLYCPIRDKDVATTDKVIFSNGIVYIKEGDRPYAYFEATATSTTHILTINGILYNKDEVK